MKITLTGGRPASLATIAKLEKRIGRPLSQSYRDFVSKNDGATPGNNIFHSTGRNVQSDVQKFLRADEILDERQHMEPLPEAAYPVAYDGSGDYIVIDEERAGAVFFWDHETNDLTPLASNFAEFLEMLEPFDPSTVKLDPKDVVSVWVHPDFQKYVKR